MGPDRVWDAQVWDSILGAPEHLGYTNYIPIAGEVLTASVAGIESIVDENYTIEWEKSDNGAIFSTAQREGVDILLGSSHEGNYIRYKVTDEGDRTLHVSEPVFVYSQLETYGNTHAGKTSDHYRLWNSGLYTESIQIDRTRFEEDEVIHGVIATSFQKSAILSSTPGKGAYGDLGGGLIVEQEEGDSALGKSRSYYLSRLDKYEEDLGFQRIELGLGFESEEISRWEFLSKVDLDRDGEIGEDTSIVINQNEVQIEKGLETNDYYLRGKDDVPRYIAWDGQESGSSEVIGAGYYDSETILLLTSNIDSVSPMKRIEEGHKIYVFDKEGRARGLIELNRNHPDIFWSKLNSFFWH